MHLARLKSAHAKSHTRCGETNRDAPSRPSTSPRCRAAAHRGCRTPCAKSRAAPPFGPHRSRTWERESPCFLAGHCLCSKDGKRLVQLTHNFGAVGKTVFEVGPCRKNILGAGKIFVLLEGTRTPLLLDPYAQDTEQLFWHCEITGQCQEWHFQEMEILKINDNGEYHIKAYV